MPCDPRQADAPALQVNKEKDVVGRQPAPREDLHGEEVDSGQHSQVRPNELLPGRVLAPLGRWRFSGLRGRHLYRPDPVTRGQLPASSANGVDEAAIYPISRQTRAVVNRAR
jgi:hypothetical protein